MANVHRMIDAESLEALAKLAIQLAGAYERSPEDKGVVDQFLRVRQELAEALERLTDEAIGPVFHSIVGQAHQAILSTNLRTETEDMPAPEQERRQATVGQGWSAPGSIQSFLALSMYRYAHELPHPFALPQVPIWLVLDYLAFMLKPPPLFRVVGEVEAYVDFIRAWTKYLADGIAAEPANPLWQEATKVFLRDANILPLYPSGQNVKDICSRRGDLLERALRIAGQSVDHEFAPRSSDRRPLRIGILAQAFRTSAETAASLPLYEHLDRNEFEVTLYCAVSGNDPVEAHCRSRAHALKVLPQSLRAQVDFLRGEQLDILFFGTNVAAVTNNWALLACHRLARVQATGIFSIITTGFRHMDYFVSGTLTEPSPEAPNHYRERLLQMEGLVHCFSYPQSETKSKPRGRAELGIDESALVFSSGANFYKLRPELMHTWARILARTPNSVLLLFPYGPNWTPNYPKAAFVRLIATILEEHGVDAKRLRIHDEQPAPTRQGIRELLRLVDVYLDSFPFGGSTSLIEPLEIGLPIVARSGDQLRSAMAPAMLVELGMPELIATDEADYIDLACALAQDGDLRKRTAAKIRERMAATPSFLDSVLYAERIAPIYRQMLEPAGRTGTAPDSSKK